jgi:cell division transport system permease protein
VRALRYGLREAAASLWHGRRSGIFAVATIALAFLVLGGFLLITHNLERLVGQWSGAADLSVYLNDEVSPSERAAVEATLAPGSVVLGREYVSKDEALSRFKQTFTDLGGSIGTLGDNPLPASFNVRLAAGTSTQTIEALSTRLRQTPGVSDVRYDRQWVERLLRAVSLIRLLAVSLGALLTLAAAFTVATVIRLALIARRDELHIMDLVGAPATYVRGPFVLEGVLQGGIGALCALLVLVLLFFSLRARYLAPLAAAVNLQGVAFLPVELWIGLLLGGMAVGCLGGIVAAWGR